MAFATANYAADGLSDEEVLGRVRAGETGLYGILAQRHHRRLLRLARRVLRDENEAEDVAQDVHLRVLTHVDQFAGRSSVLTWLTRITVNEALSRLRTRARRPVADLSVVELGFASASVPSPRNPEESAIEEEARRRATRVVTTLPAKYRGVVILRELQELTSAEAARCLGLTQKCVNTRLHRARNLLRVHYAQ